LTKRGLSSKVFKSVKLILPIIVSMALFLKTISRGCYSPAASCELTKLLKLASSRKPDRYEAGLEKTLFWLSSSLSNDFCDDDFLDCECSGLGKAV